MYRRCRLLFIFLVLLIFVLTFASASAQNESPESQKKGAYHNQKGLEYFKKGFYDLAPNKKDKEAEQYYQQAIAEFKQAIDANPEYEEAHRNLARVYFIKKDFEKAAEQYKKVVTLRPSDIDAHVNLALSYLALDKYDDAIQALENAKSETSDESVIKKLDGYIQKIQQNR
jgi:tetratricopeptide (TPR) repeat protein